MRVPQPAPAAPGRDTLEREGLVMRTRVVHCKHRTHDVYIGRPSIWGNPFALGKDGDREQVIKKYAAWLQTQPHLLARVHELREKTLGCWCAPLPCHGDVLAALADAAQAGKEH